jgi:pimeloyl-ACP methyl ester carboxylesterase
MSIEEIAARVAKLTQVPLNSARVHARSIIQLDTQTLDQLLDGSALESWNTDGLLVRVACPVLYLYGEPSRGGVLELADVKRAKPKLTQCETVFMARAGHMIHTFRPNDFARAVQQFLSRLKRTRSFSSKA